jgi:hypothetical protein
MMPPLPPPTDKWRDADTRELLPRWNDSALLAYGRAVAEACAVVCDGRDFGDNGPSSMAARRIAAAIREMASGAKPE